MKNKKNVRGDACTDPKQKRNHTDCVSRNNGITLLLWYKI